MHGMQRAHKLYAIYMMHMIYVYYKMHTPCVYVAEAAYNVGVAHAVGDA